MGLVITADENEQGVEVEIRRETVIFGPTGIGDEDMFDCIYSDIYGWYVEVDKAYLNRLLEFFGEHLKYLRKGK